MVLQCNVESTSKSVIIGMCFDQRQRDACHLLTCQTYPVRPVSVSDHMQSQWVVGPILVPGRAVRNPGMPARRCNGRHLGKERDGQRQIWAAGAIARSRLRNLIIRPCLCRSGCLPGRAQQSAAALNTRKAGQTASLTAWQAATWFGCSCTVYSCPNGRLLVEQR